MTATAIAALALAALSPSAARAQPADARAQAGAAFKRAVAAEDQQDWATALREYELAYQLSPHPDVLFNLAAVYERTGAHRTAAVHYQRYLDGSPKASDRAAVTAKLEALRLHPAKLTVIARPVGATVVIDGKRIGGAPVTRELRGGAHQITVESDGAQASRVVTLEYGEPQRIELAAVAGEGTLVVTSNAAGATVTLDGQAVGVVPWTGTVPAGPHTVVIAAAGYTTTERAVDVPADGTAQIQGALGRPVGWVAPTPPSKTTVRVAVDSGAYLGQGYELALTAMYRSSGRRAEVGSGFQFGVGGLAWALRLRLFLLTDAVRPYAVGALNYGFNGESTAYAGGGVLIPTRGSLPMDFYVESGYGVGKNVDDDFAFVPVMAGVSFGR